MSQTFRALFIAATLAHALPRRRSHYQRISPLRRRSRKMPPRAHILAVARGIHSEACFCEMCLETL